MREILRPVARIGFATAILLITAGCVAARPVASPAPAAEPEIVWEAPPALEEPVRAPERDILGDIAYDLPLEANSWVEAELDFLVGDRPEVISRWLERGDYYEPFIKSVLREHGLPTDLYHMAMIESGFVPTARSRAGAVGLWQFMPATGRQMGLRVERDVDERMDPVRSTRAAARHLRWLHQTLGDWALAAAAYNAGSGRISRGLSAFGAKDFWELAQRGDLAKETREYVPRLYAVTIIARDRPRFGFAPAALEEQFAYDSVHVEFATPIPELARIADLDVESVRRLNPHLINGITPSDGYWVWVPAGQGAHTQRAWLASDFRRDRGLGTYVVRAGDNLSMLASRSGVGAARIRELNPSVSFDPLQIGVRLRLPYAAAQALSERAESRPALASAEPRGAEPGSPPVPGRASASGDGSTAPVSAVPAAGRADSVAPGHSQGASDGGASGAARTGGTAAQAGSATHEVVAGETLWGIARQHGVTVAAVESANGLEGSTIRPGQRLRIPGVSGVTDRAPTADGNEGRAAEPASAPERIEHRVSPGETLWGIARRFGTTVEAIRAANDLGDQPIQPGQTLVIERSGGGR